jgi:hypothetical protein
MRRVESKDELTASMSTACYERNMPTDSIRAFRISRAASDALFRIIAVSRLSGLRLRLALLPAAFRPGT